MADSPKNDHWQEVVLTDTGVVPGTYSPAEITVGADGRITSATNATVPDVSIVSTVTGLSTIASPSNGDLAIVLDDGSGNEEIYVWNSANSDLGAPLFRWRLLSSTLTQVQRTDYRQDTLSLVTKDLSTPIPDSGIIKEIAVTITTAYSGGATISIQDDTGFVYVPAASINAQLVGTYKTFFDGNVDTVLSNGSGQLRAVVGGAPGAGAAVVFAQYIDT